MAFYRATFPSLGHCSPKDAHLGGPHHPLDEEVSPGGWSDGRTWAESIHAHLMRLERIHQGIANEVQRLKYIVREHMLESAPSLTSLRPPSAPRKWKKRDNDSSSSSEEED